MAKNMYQKREERKNKSTEVNNNKININWDISIYGNTYANPCKIKLS